ncbi:MAG: hypothetical protein LBP29_01215, partial [Treponema sp.]|nr:hypothetical protein [Treponema sp.]
EDFTGTIQFTNTPGYYHSADGTARVEKKGESIKVTMLCSIEMETLIREKYPNARPPFYMVLEF